jgi:type IV pilus assembly protein PilF
MRILSIFMLFLLLALTGCRTSMTNDPPRPLSASAQAGRASAIKVMSYLRQGYTDKAQENLARALYQAPNDPVVLDAAGYYYEKTGRIQLANSYFRQAVRTNPTLSIVKNNYGAFLCRNGFYAQSLPFFRKAARMPDRIVASEAQRNAEFCEAQSKSRLGVSAT